MTLTEHTEEDKSPGPDGYSSGFFKVALPIVGDEVTRAVLDFFHNGKLLRQVNATLLVLIPKVQAPSHVSDFRPISCCNVLYKVITKIIAQRLSLILDYLVSPSQNDFVPGRSIGDNALLAQELFTGYIISNTYRQDDLLLFCKLEATSIGLFQQGLERFALMSGLHANPNCKPLLRRIDERIKGWEGINLSFAGRVQLIQSVMMALHMYWAIAFILPKGVIREVEKRLCTFLWKGQSGVGYAKVAWNNVCRPKEEGGLGIRNVLAFNRALMSRHLWRVITRDRKSIWVE
ncbi:UNVERIFIED_CONTAM: hypothetical protein Slati_0881000 [Sesamum latifolium]|uniref:Reverse transcriptase domain-containing protein n=1 Tax=Sesamum latifolium TaxID=2727402 RepID=A0AAW2XNG1_9LAMI